MIAVYVVFGGLMAGCAGTKPNQDSGQTAAPVLQDFGVSPSIVGVGVQTWVTWTWSYTGSPWPEPTCTLDQGVGELENGGTSSLTLEDTTTYTLECVNSEGHSSSQVDVRPAFLVPATETDFTSDYTATIEGTGRGRLKEISVQGNSGFVTFDGRRIPILVYYQYYWDVAQSLTFTILGIEEDRLSTFWAYCDTSGDLSQLWYETSDGVEVTYENAQGKCTTSDEPYGAVINLPALQVPEPTLVDGFTLSGTHLAWDGTTPAELDLSGEPWMAYPYNLVDCTEICGDPGAWELHSLLWNPATSELCFGIFDLWTPSDGSVYLSLTLCLPDLVSRDTNFTADYTAPTE